MAHYTKDNPPEGLQSGDEVTIRGLRYQVDDGFLVWLDGPNNDQCFAPQDPVELARVCYGYEPYRYKPGMWPECTRGDYPALTRLVRALLLAEETVVPTDAIPTGVIEEAVVPTGVLEEARALMNGPRGADYGDVRVNMARWRDAVRLLVPGCENITAEQLTKIMAILKLSRDFHRGKRDNLVDGAAFLDMTETCRGM